jgi:hypothetical protein
MYGRSAAFNDPIKDDDVLDRVRTCHELGRLVAVEGVALRRAGLRVPPPRGWAWREARRGASRMTTSDGVGVSGVRACPLLRP